MFNAPPAEYLLAVFTKFDGDHDGTLDLPEVRDLLSWPRHRRCLVCSTAFVAKSPPLPCDLVMDLQNLFVRRCTHNMGLSQHGLSSKTMALITSECGASRAS